MLFTLDNYTYYSTEDLAALVEALERQILASSGSVNRAFLQAYSGEGERVGTSVSFKDYTTKKMDDGMGSRAYVKPEKGYRRRAENDIRIVPPKRLWMNPLEALAACAGAEGEDASVLPAEAKQQLAERLAQLYQGLPFPRSGRNVAANLAAAACRDSPPIRILSKRQGTIGKAEKHRVARHRARDAWNEADYSFERVEKYLWNLTKSHTTALGILARSKAPPTPEELELDRRMAVLNQALVAVGESLDGFRSTSEDTD